MEVKVRITQEYGNERIYPVNFVEELRVLTGRKTLTRRDIQALNSLGVQCKLAQEQLSLI